jgi:hypothetical protein
LCPGLLEQGSSSVSTPAETPPPSEFNSDNEETNYDILFTSDLIAEARQQLMQLCVSIAKTQLGPDKDLSKLSLLWLQRAQASHKGAVAHFMQQLLKSNAIDTSIKAYKSLTASLNDNTWKYVFQTRDILRTENLTASIALERSTKANAVLADRNRQLQARVEQLESTVSDLNSANRKSLQKATSLENKLTRLQDDKDLTQGSLGTCCQCDGKVSKGRGSVYCKSCDTGATQAFYGDPTGWYSEKDKEAAKQDFLDEALREAEENVADAFADEAADFEAEEAAATATDQKEVLEKIEAENRLDAERLQQIQELVAASLEHLSKKEKTRAAEVKPSKKKKKKKKKTARSTDDEGGSSSSTL